MAFGSDGKQVMDRLVNTRVKSAENLLYTPQKQAKFPRTPENSTKKMKLLRLNYFFLNTFLKFLSFFKDLPNLKVHLKIINLGKKIERIEL